MPTGKQIRAARVLAGWDIKDLAPRAGLSVTAVQNIETGAIPKPATEARIVKAFFEEGVEFTDNEGVRRRNDMLRVFDGNASYLEVLEDVFLTLRETGGEVLFSFICNKLSPPEVIESQIRLRRLGIRFRCLIEEGDNYCLYPLNEYRVVPKKFFHNSTQVIYGDKVASMLKQHGKRAIVIRDTTFADTQRKIFEIIWGTYAAPIKTTAPKTYE
ncbi:MAG: helix-turn-helix domain-containing protein [Alphaproteobacteria bacterium]|nr:helix-turn-helix domain-containing protein [Alphaproteobacteria bacterium]